MKYFAQERPRLGNGLPMYLTADGYGVAALPELIITMLDEEKVRVSIWVKQEYGFGRVSCTEDRVDLGNFVQQWLKDPEAVMRASFNYQPEIRGGQVSEVATTSADAMDL